MLSHLFFVFPDISRKNEFKMDQNNTLFIKFNLEEIRPTYFS